jgi:hypothetical protein
MFVHSPSHAKPKSLLCLWFSMLRFEKPDHFEARHHAACRCGYGTSPAAQKSRVQSERSTSGRATVIQALAAATPDTVAVTQALVGHPVGAVLGHIGGC